MDPDASTPIQPLSTYTPQDDASKYIRTYAKDFAALAGSVGADMADAPKPPPPPMPRALATGQPDDASRVAADTGVALPEYDPSPVNHSDAASPKEFEQEAVDLKASDSDGIFASGATANDGAPEVAVASAPLAPAEAIAPHPAVEMDAVPTAPQETEADRETILARLRAKVSAQRDAETHMPVVALPEPVSQPLPEPEPEPLIRAAAPDLSDFPDFIPPRPQPVPEVPAPAPEVARASAKEELSPIHTYSSDFADHIDAQGSSTFSVLAAQSDAGQTPRPQAPKKRLAIVPLLAGGAMLIIGIGAIVGAYLFVRNGSALPMATNVPSAISFDESVEVKGTGQDLMQAIANVAQGGSVSGDVVVTYVTLATTTGSGIPQPGGTLIKELGLGAPDILLRNIDDTSTVGVIRAGSESRPFMILKVSSYERTFAGMLAWEPTMAEDLATFYPAYSDAVAASTTASTSVAALPPAPTAFADDVVANYDVRVLRDAAGRSLMLYGYYGKDTLVIARDEAAFTALIARLSAAGK